MKHQLEIVLRGENECNSGRVLLIQTCIPFLQDFRCDMSDKHEKHRYPNQAK